ncbi:MAG: L,D-transpeptidase [Candidatus Nanoarchaeia archaeon]
MLAKKTLYAGLISLGLLAGCANPHLDPSYRQKVSYEPSEVVEQKKTEKTIIKDEKSEKLLEETIDEVYITINKTTDKGVPKLYLKDANTHEKYKQMPVAIGAGDGVYDGEWKDWKTPEGEFEIAGIFYKPVWYPTDDDKQEPVKPGKNNPLGDWMFVLLDGNHEYDKKDINSWSGADWRLLRIHSTNQPDSIGKKVSKGCVRLHPDDAETLADFLLNNSNYSSAMAGEGNPSYSQNQGFKSTFRGHYKPFKETIKVYIRD